MIHRTIIKYCPNCNCFALCLVTALVDDCMQCSPFELGKRNGNGGEYVLVQHRYDFTLYSILLRQQRNTEDKYPFSAENRMSGESEEWVGGKTHNVRKMSPSSNITRSENFMSNIRYISYQLLFATSPVSC